MKNERRRTQELIKLSDYLDDSLSAAQRKKIEARLARDPELQQRLKNLRRTKIILWRLPRLHAPRNFTLTPDMVTVRKPKQQVYFTSLRLASALAAILLVVLFGVERLLGAGLLSARLSSESFIEEAAKVAEVTPQPLIQWGQSGNGGGSESDVNGMGGDSVSMEEPMVAMEAAPVEGEMAGEALAEEAVEAAPVEGEMVEEALPEEDVEAVPAPEMAPLPREEAEMVETDDQAVEGKDLILGINPEQSGEIIDRSEPAAKEGESLISWRNVLRWAQVALAVIAVGGGIALWLLRRKRAA